MFNGPLEFLPEELDKKFSRVTDHKILDPGDTIVFMSNLRSELAHGTIATVDDTFFSVDPNSEETVRARYLHHHIIWMVNKAQMKEPIAAGSRVLFDFEGQPGMAIRIIDKGIDKNEYAWVILAKEHSMYDGWVVQGELPRFWSTILELNPRPYKE